jgi:hypothetical protein
MLVGPFKQTEVERGGDKQGVVYHEKLDNDSIKNECQ